MRQLAWKAWHEQAWKLAFGCVVLAAVAAIGLHARMVPDATLVAWVAGLGATLLPVLAVSGLVPADRAEGGLEALMALPVRPWRVLAASTVAGVVLVAGPLAVAAAVSVTMAGGREMYTGELVAFYGKTTLVAVDLFVWMLAATVRLPSEARAALVAVGVLLIWALVSIPLGYVPDGRGVAYCLSPAALLIDPTPRDQTPTPAWVIYAVQAASVAGVWTAAAWGFGRSTEDRT